MNYKEYKAEYDKAAEEMKAALAEFNGAQARVMVIQKKMAALHVLMELDKPLSSLSPEERREIEMSEQVMHATSKAADAIRRIFLVTDTALKPGQIREELKKSGYDLSRHKNVAAMIDSVCKRLAEQGFIAKWGDGKDKVWAKTF